MSALSSSRSDLFTELHGDIREHLAVRNVTTPAMEDRGHQSLVWDATEQPTGSHYFPVYVELFEALERQEEIHPERTFVVETTTGNAGSAAAYVAGRLGYDILVFMPEDMPDRRIEHVRQHLSDRSELRLTESGRYVAGTVRQLKRFLATHRDGYRGKEVTAMNHSRRSESVRAIRRAAAHLLDMKVDVEQIDGCALALGNGTTFSGIGHAVRERYPEAQLVGVEPVESPWFYVQKYGEDRLRERYGIDPGGHEHHLLGTGGWGVDFPNVDIDFIDDIHLTFEQEWHCMLDRLHDAGHRVGHTSAACQWVTEQLSARAALSGSNTKTFFGVFYDPIEKYG